MPTLFILWLFSEHSGHRLFRRPASERPISLPAVCKCLYYNLDAQGFKLGDQVSKICFPTLSSPGIPGPDSRYRTRKTLPSREQTALSLRSCARDLESQRHPYVRFYMRVLCLMVASFEAVPFTQFYSRPPQHNILLA